MQMPAAAGACGEAEGLLPAPHPAPAASCASRGCRRLSPAVVAAALLLAATVALVHALGLPGGRPSSLVASRGARPGSLVAVQPRSTAAHYGIALKVQVRNLDLQALLASGKLLGSFYDAVEDEVVRWLPPTIAAHEGKLTMVVELLRDPVRVVAAIEMTGEDLATLREGHWDVDAYASALVGALAQLRGVGDVVVGPALEACGAELEGVQGARPGAPCARAAVSVLTDHTPVRQHTPCKHAGKLRSKLQELRERRRWHRECVRAARHRGPWTKGQWLRCWHSTTTVTSTTTTTTSTTSSATTTTSTTSSTTSTTSRTSTTSTVSTTTTSTTSTTSTATETTTVTTATTTTSTTSTITTTPDDPCSPQPCLNGGVCSEDPAAAGGFVCQCAYGWGGTICDVPDQVLEWDEASEARRITEYNTVANVHPIQWVGACGDAAVTSMPQSHDCTVHNIQVQDVVQPDGSTEKYFTFYGIVGPTSPAQCANNAYSCAGPSMQTKPVTAQGGDKAKFAFRAERGGDYYEVLIEVLACFSAAPCMETDYLPNDVVLFNRGFRMNSYTQVVYTFGQEGSYKLRFHLGSYDYTGGTVLGANMFVKKFMLESAAGGAPR